MIELHKGLTAEKIIVTLDELKTINEAYYLFVFTHVLTKRVVKFIKHYDEDESQYPQRYNQFELNTHELFTDRPIGEWHYRIYQQESETNVNVTQTGGQIESGKMILYGETSFDYTKYNQPTSYKVYAG